MTRTWNTHLSATLTALVVALACSQSTSPTAPDLTGAESTVSHSTEATSRDTGAAGSVTTLGTTPPSNKPGRTYEAEAASLSGPDAGTVATPFDGAALYGNGDVASFEVTFPDIPGVYLIEVRAASSAATATADLSLNSVRIDALRFGTNPTTTTTQVTVRAGSSSVQNLSIEVTGDDGSWNLYVDRVSVTLVQPTGSVAPAGTTPTGTGPTSSAPAGTAPAGAAPAGTAPPGVTQTPVYESRQYRNLFVELGKSEAEVDARVDAVVSQLFYGNDSQKIYYEKGGDEAYIYTADTDDVRSEGMSYGMMISVQLNKKAEFDKLWKFAKSHMQNQSGSLTGYFAWQVRTDGSHIDSYPAPDGDEYFAMSLLMAEKRWGNGSGIYNYEAEANTILDHMLNHPKLSNSQGVPALINPTYNQIIFSPGGDQFTDPSYHVPHFYELFGRWAAKDNQRWLDIADTSRQLLQKACHPSTGLAPDYCTFDGRPTGGEHAQFRFDAWRVAMNIALDAMWWNKDTWARDTWVQSYLGFFSQQGVSQHLNQFNIDGSGANGDHSPGLVAMNAIAALISDEDMAWDFVQEFWDTPPNVGTYRYYDGCLYLFGLLNVTGRYRIIGN